MSKEKMIRSVNIRKDTHERIMEIKRQKNLLTPYNNTIDMIINELIDIAEGKEK